MLAAWPLNISAKEVSDMESRALPQPRRTGQLAVETALARRRSVRTFADQALRYDQLGQALWAAQGITGARGRLRSAPSAGALYPLAVYALVGRVDGLPNGVYRYRAQAHQLDMIIPGDHRRALARAALGQGWMAHAPVTVVIAGVVARTAQKYGPRAERYVCLEAGHAAQNIYLQAQAEGLGTTAVGAFRDEAVHALIGMDPGEMPLYLLPLGQPRGDS
jgi:SagB-type dehydrogenase family enzyme